MRERQRRLALGRGIVLAVAATILACAGAAARAAKGEIADAGAVPTGATSSSTAFPPTGSPPPIPPRPVAAAAYFTVPLDSPLYDDLEHFRALGLWRGSLEMRPLRRDVFVRAAASIRATAGGRRLSSRDAVRLLRLEDAVHGWGLDRIPAITNMTGGYPTTSLSAGSAPMPAAGSVSAPAVGSALTTATGVAAMPAAAPAGDPPARAEFALAVRLAGNASDLDSLANLDRRSRREQFVMLSVDGALDAHAFFQWRAYEDYDRLTPFRRGDRWADNLPPRPREVLTSPSARNDRAVIGAGWRWGDVRLGREDRRWGTGRQGTLFLGENPFPLDGISARFDTRFLAGSSLLAQLRRGTGIQAPVGSAPDTLPPLTGGDSWLAAHRIELRPPGPVRLGIYEAVAWSGRGVDLGYANPVAFLLAVSQDLFDRAAAAGDANIDDKKVIGFDFAAEIAPVSLYGELLINRIVTLDANQGPDSDATTWAQLGGLRWANPLGLTGADLDLEYAHLDPEVYFHKDRDPGRALLSEGELLGHWLGPNTDSFHARLGMPVGARFGAVAVSFERSRWGVIDGLRGTEIGFFHLRKRDKRWITGRVEAERIFAAEWRREAFRLSTGFGLDAEARLARVDRSGMRTRDGWQAELRLTCRAGIEVNR